MASKIICDGCGKDIGKHRNYEQLYVVPGMPIKSLSVFGNTDTGQRADLCRPCADDAILAISRSLFKPVEIVGKPASETLIEDRR